MFRYRVNYTILLLITLLFSMVYQSRIGSVLLLTMIIVPTLSWLIGLISRFLVSVGFNKDEFIIEKGKDIKIGLVINNPSIMPLSPILVRGFFPDYSSNHIKQQSVVTTTPPRTENIVFFRGSFKYRGCFEISINKTYIFDALKLHKFKINKIIKARVMILPRLILLNPIRGVSADDKELEAHSLFGFEKSVFSSIRDYREGDLLQSVHWKLSAKQDELLVKQYEESLSSDSAIIFDYGCDFNLGERALISSDVVVETAIALAHAVAVNNDKVHIIWEDGKEAGQLSESIISNVEEFYAFYNDAAALPIRKNSLSISEIFEMRQVKFLDSRMILVISPWYNQSTVNDIHEMAKEGIKKIFYIYIFDNNPDNETRNSTERNIVISKLDYNNLKTSLDNLLKEN